MFVGLFVFLLQNLQDLSSLTRDWTQVLAVKVPSPNHWTAREFPRSLFLLAVWTYLNMCTIDQSVDGHFLLFLVIINKTAMNIQIQVFLWTCDFYFSCIKPKSRNGSCRKYMLNFKETVKLFSCQFSTFSWVSCSVSAGELSDCSQIVSKKTVAFCIPACRV